MLTEMLAWWRISPRSLDEPGAGFSVGQATLLDTGGLTHLRQPCRGSWIRALHFCFSYKTMKPTEPAETGKMKSELCRRYFTYWKDKVKSTKFFFKKVSLDVMYNISTTRGKNNAVLFHLTLTNENHIYWWIKSYMEKFWKTLTFNSKTNMYYDAICNIFLPLGVFFLLML